jgi:uncharacterized protein with NRDE domain
MCLLLLALDVVPGRPWLLLGNRDELHARPSAAAQAWADAPDVVGGRDLQAGGSWLALNRNGRYAAVTNVRSGRPRSGARSRGELVAGFVRGEASAQHRAAEIAGHRGDYGPFNLILGDARSAWGVSSLEAEAWPMKRGIHVLSNGAPGVLWPKVRRLRERFAAHVQNGNFDDAVLLDLLADAQRPHDEELPDTGVGIELERFLAPIFIRGTDYGTRASTLAYAQGGAGAILNERRFGPDGVALGESRLTI